ncbi:hypothetical protein AOT96_10615 [Rhodococcus sp. 008]|nr:hypothetical protein AOT96_10615 [Rhodococcus sp. 008]
MDLVDGLVLYRTPKSPKASKECVLRLISPHWRLDRKRPYSAHESNRIGAIERPRETSTETHDGNLIDRNGRANRFRSFD